MKSRDYLLCLVLIVIQQILSFTNKGIGKNTDRVFLNSPRSKSVLFGGFDEDFANSISKPLPDWYVKDLKQRREIEKVIIANRERQAEEFRKKYEQSSSEIVRLQNTKKTKEELEEEKKTGFYLPGFFEVFPELKLKWPKWVTKKDGSAVECETDRDCQFPQACCQHPIIPMKKFCCTGYGQRALQPLFVGQEIQVHYTMNFLLSPLLKLFFLFFFFSFSRAILNKVERLEKMMLLCPQIQEIIVVHGDLMIAENRQLYYCTNVQSFGYRHRAGRSFDFSHMHSLLLI